MDFFKEIFSQLSTSESLLALLWLFIAGLIGFMTAWFYWKSNIASIQKEFDAAERDAAELRIRNTELLMTHEEIRKEIADSKTEVANIKETNKILSREKGQLYADMTLAKKELADYQSSKEKMADKKPIVNKPKIEEPEISLENVMKASATLSGITAPEVEDGHSALQQKKVSGDSQSEAADFIKKAMGSRIKAASAKHKDNLQMIKGVGPFIEGKLNKLGLFTFEQISQLDEELIEKLTDAIQFFPGRILRDDWVGQAKSLMS